MMRENRMEMKMNEMIKVAGGYILNQGFLRDWCLVNDNTGEKMEGFPILGDAQNAATKAEVSRIIITEKEYKEIFNKIISVI